MVRYLEKNKLLLALGLAIFFFFVHYSGYNYDAALYLLQVMYYLQPERFVNDVPFMFGNQGSFSLFSPVIAIVFKSFGVNVGGIVATLVLQVALGLAIISLVYKWCKSVNAELWTLPVIMLMFCLLAGKEYGPAGFYLPMLESLLVARLASEVLTIMGLAFFFSKNRYVSLALFVLASLMHPLMGGWALPLWFFVHFPKFRIPVSVLAFLFPLSGFLHIGRLDFYSNDWNPIFFRPEWNEVVLYSGLLLFWVAMYRHFKEGVFARFSLNLFWVSLIGFYLQFAGSYMEHILLFQVQPFRVQWLCTISVIPVFAIYVRDCLINYEKLNFRNYAGFVLGLCAIAGCQWSILLIICLVFLISPIGNKHVEGAPVLLTKALFIFGLVFMLANSIFCNIIQLSLEQGIGNANMAVSWIHFPSYVNLVENVLLIVFALICMSQKKYGYALIFAVAFGCGCLKIFPIVTLLLCLMPNLRSSIKMGLLAFSISFSFLELLSMQYRSNSTEIMPLENATVACLLLLVMLFLISYWIMNLKNDMRGRNALVPFWVLIVSLSTWDIYRWDARSEYVILNEKQMDVFFKTPVFPQVKDRGKLLFSVDCETPVQSRMNFLTGAYADESIFVGEVFYKYQFMESNRRRSALLTGSSKMTDLSDFSEKMMRIYHNPDSILSRVRYLCGEGEITHFATDYAQMPLKKNDSVYLDIKKKNVYLYGCEK